MPYYGKDKCPCKSTGCERHGDCDACRAYHGARGSATTCERQEANKQKGSGK